MCVRVCVCVSECLVFGLGWRGRRCGCGREELANGTLGHIDRVRGGAECTRHGRVPLLGERCRTGQLKMHVM